MGEEVRDFLAELNGETPQEISSEGESPDSGETTVEKTKAETETPPEETSTGAPAVETPSTESPVSETPVDEPSPAPATQTTQVESPATPQVDPEEARKRALAEFANGYALTDDQASEMMVSPQTVVPNLLAQVRFDTMQQMMGAFQRMLPSMIEQTNASTQAAKNTEDAFFKEYPDLKAHQDAVRTAAQTYKQLNPQATTDEIRQKVGPMARAMLGLSAPAASVENATTVTTPVVPGKPASTAQGGGAPVEPEMGEMEGFFDTLINDLK